MKYLLNFAFFLAFYQLNAQKQPSMEYPITPKVAQIDDYFGTKVNDPFRSLEASAAHSTEMNKETPFPVITMMEDQKKITNKGGTMRLGAYTCDLRKGSRGAQAYEKPK